MKRGIIVNDRDREIFRNLFEHRLLSLDLIWHKFFPNTTRQNVGRRLVGLSRNRFIKKRYLSLEEKPYIVFALENKGFNEFVPSYCFDPMSIGSQSDSPEHDLVLFRIRERLSSLSMIANYYTENMLQYCFDLKKAENLRAFSELNSDVAMEVRMKGKVFFVALEYEGIEKKQDRIRDKLLEYYMKSGVTAVFWIHKSDRVKKAIMTADQDLRPRYESKMFYASLDSVLKQQGEMIFHGLNMDKVVLK